MKTKDRKPGLHIPIGELVDRLSIINIKMWHVDEGISKAHKAGEMEAAGELAIQARDLNRQRSDVREEINIRIEGVSAGTNKLEYVNKHVGGRG